MRNRSRRGLVLAVGVMANGIADRAEITRRIGRQRFAAHVFLIVGGMTMRIVPVLAVRAVHQLPGDLIDPLSVDKEKRTDRQRRRGRDAARCCPAQIQHMAAREQRENRHQRNAPQQIAEEDEEEHRPEKRDESIGVFFECRAENFHSQKFEDRFEEVFAARRHAAVGAVEQARKNQQHENRGDQRHQHLIGQMQAREMYQIVRQHIIQRIHRGQ
jgi:hypothetical protein